MDFSQLEEKVENAISTFFELDFYLLTVNVNERSISHRLAQYLQQEFDDWDVDCEYNRNRDDTKRLLIGEHIGIPIQKINSDDTEGRTVYPDIIVHRRGTDMNLLVIEIKKSSNNQSRHLDIIKLQEYGNQLGYIHRLFLCFTTGDNNIRNVEKIWI